jgi:prolyl oligopeptidase
VTRLATIADRVASVQCGPDRDLFVLSTRDAPRGRILRAPLANPRLDRARTVIAEGPEAIVSDLWEAEASPVVAGTRLFVPYQTGGPMDLRVLDLEGRLQREAGLTGPARESLRRLPARPKRHSLEQ